MKIKTKIGLKSVQRQCTIFCVFPTEPNVVFEEPSTAESVSPGIGGFADILSSTSSNFECIDSNKFKNVSYRYIANLIYRIATNTKISRQ
mgnify:CR=1 FL=1